MKSRPAPLSAKILLSVFSFVFFLSLLEVGLWAVGQIYFEPESEYRTDEIVRQDGQPTTSIVAVGDSFTHGGLVEGHETYTAHLRNRLEVESVDDVKVFNKGICELNTHELVRRYEKILDEYDPDVVLLLVGATNRFNPWDYEVYANKNIFTSTMSWLADRRVVKMWRFIRLNLAGHTKNVEDNDKDKLIFLNLRPTRNITTAHDLHQQYIEEMLENTSPVEYDPIRQGWYLFNAKKFDQAIKVVLGAIAAQKVSREDAFYALAYFYMQGGKLSEHQQTMDLLRDEFADSERFRNSEVFYEYEYANYYKDRLEYDRAIDYYLRAIAKEPNADYFYYELNKLYELQSIYDALAIHQKLQKLQDDNQLLSLSPMFQKHLDLYADKQAWDAGVEQWIYDDLSRIAQMSQKRGARLVMQNYPSDYVMPNRVIDRIVNEYGLMLIDHNTVFQGLKPIETYLLDDDHCSSQGHKVMADTIYQTLVNEKLIKL